MNFKSFITGLGFGLGVAVIISEGLMSRETIPSGTALRLAKNAMREQGPIVGSWIHTKTEPYKHHNISYTIYKGGISLQGDNETKEFTFIMDAETGTIIDVIPL